MKLKLIKKFIFNACAALLTYSICINTVSNVSADSWSVSYTRYRQEKTNWCWAASAQSSAKHMVSSAKTQTDAVVFVKGSNVNEGGTIFETARAANYFTNNKYVYTGYERKFSYVLFKAQIMANQIPIVFMGKYKYTIRVRGHAVTVHALYQGNKNEIILTYYDPWEDRDFQISYDNFCDNPNTGVQYDYTCVINL